MIESNSYNANGYKDRADYLDSLKDEFDADKVDLLSDMLGPSEDFDGLVTALEDDSAGL